MEWEIAKVIEITGASKEQIQLLDDGGILCSGEMEPSYSRGYFKI